ncbi:MAG: alanine dehydrogenase [Clostridia bacterium]|nr:alanine dehydrogenase [Clostridia bacterium]
MVIGIPGEIKTNENRVSATPAGVSSLLIRGHSVLVQSGAGEGSGFLDSEYAEAGAEIVDTAQEVFRRADMIVKVKEPQPSECEMLREGQILFTYLHLASSVELTKSLLERKITGIAYETVQLDDGSLPLLIPMSRIAGRLSVQVGADLLLKYKGGRGILLGGSPGVEAGKVLIIGAGTVGESAARIAVGLGAKVTVMDINPVKLAWIDELYQGRINTLYSNEYEIAAQVRKADLLIGAVLVPGAKAPKLVSEDMVRTMKNGSVIVDVAIDQGGSIETIDRATTHENPSYVKHGVVHYSVANMPGAVPRTSTKALEGATLPYIALVADKKLVAFGGNKALKLGLNTYNGMLTNDAVAASHGMKYTPFK